MSYEAVQGGKGRVPVTGRGSGLGVTIGVGAARASLFSATQTLVLRSAPYSCGLRV